MRRGELGLQMSGLEDKQGMGDYVYIRASFGRTTCELGLTFNSGATLALNSFVEAAASVCLLIPVLKVLHTYTGVFN